MLRWGLLALGVGALVSAQLVGTGHRAQADSAPVEAGSAIATASVLGAVPIVGNTNLSVTVGGASASYQESEARSNSQTLDLGGLGVILANTPLCGQIYLPATRQPKALTDDTVGGPPNATNGLAGVGAGAESVTATPAPESASATTTPIGQSIPGLLSVGGQATTAVHYVSGSEREAQSSVQLDLSIANGLIALNGMNWSSVQHTGTTALAQGSFSVGSIKVGPLTVPAPSPTQLATAIAAANKLLSALGLSLVMPTVSTDPATGTVIVTPFQITVGKSALSDAVISPLISAASSLEAAINGQTVSGNDCANAKVLVANLANPAETVANVALGVFSNGGGFDLDLGGTTADTLAPTDFTNPFGAGDATTPDGALPPSSLGAGGIGSGSFGGALPGAAGGGIASGGGATGGSTSTTTTPAQAAAPATLTSATHCQTTSPAGQPGCWSGDAAIVGIVAVAAGAALFLADTVRGRRSRRRGRPDPAKEALT
ncbi:MAG TPA: hypothetical protein VG298_01525 [Acidimicrobiales bacterium]|nr:hypothetical protein [Acidimicrobiales bacterium]